MIGLIHDILPLEYPMKSCILGVKLLVRIWQQLTEHGLVPEAWGGDTIAVKVSALMGDGIDELLEYVLLVAEVQDLKANPKAEASGVVTTSARYHCDTPDRRRHSGLSQEA